MTLKVPLSRRAFSCHFFPYLEPRALQNDAVNSLLTTGIAWVTPSPLSMTVPVNVRSPTCRDVHDAAKASTAWTRDTHTMSRGAAPPRSAAHPQAQPVRRFSLSESERRFPSSSSPPKLQPKLDDMKILSLEESSFQ